MTINIVSLETDERMQKEVLILTFKSRLKKRHVLYYSSMSKSTNKGKENGLRCESMCCENGVISAPSK